MRPINSFATTRADLERLFRIKYGDLENYGWGPRTRKRLRYFSPDDHYEALLLRLVSAGCTWLDVGCGRALFPSNPPLARLLANRVAVLVGVDPDPTLDENPFVHERVLNTMEAFQGEQRFDLVTMRMVAEHVTEPEDVVASVARALKPGGLAVVYTVNRFSPVPLITGVVPFALHHPAKWFLWGAQRKDTFPTAFRMNTRTRLRRLFESQGLGEVYFAYLDDCRTFGRFRLGLWLELVVWRCLQAIGLRYPETCLLGVYCKK